MKKLFLVLILGLFITMGLASAEVIYNSIDNPLPGSYPSVGYEATSTFEMGDHIEFAGVDRNLESIEVVLTNWACENDFTLDGDGWIANREGSEACVTTPGSGFNHPITLNIYQVDNSGANPAVGPLIISKTETFFIEFRPSWDSVECTDTEEKQTPTTDIPFGGKWYDPVLGACVHGYNQIIEFDFSGDSIELPEEVIYTVAYNTANYGEEPIGSPGPYSSLNYGLSSSALIGTDVEPATAFLYSTWAGNYCDLGVDGTGTLRRDADCWEGYVPTARFTTCDECTGGGYYCDTGIGIGVGVTPTNSCPEILQEACNEGGPQLSVCYDVNTGVYDCCGDSAECIEEALDLGLAGRSYVFEGETVSFNAIVSDVDGINQDCVKVFVTLEKNEEDPIEAACVLDHTNANEREWEGVVYPPGTIGWFNCLFTVEPAVSGMVGEYWVSIIANDTCGGKCTDSAAGVISLYLNPAVSLTIESQDPFGLMYDVGGDLLTEVHAGDTVYSPYFTVENTAIAKSGLYLLLQIYGKDMWDYSPSGALCPDSNNLDIQLVQYKASHLNVQQGWTSMPENYANKEFVFRSPNIAGNFLGVGDDVTMRLMLPIPTPCVGNFDDGGEIVFVGMVV